ncbi:hypothetical protein Ancab_028154 [Ancistrocladus abbreviatus]
MAASQNTLTAYHTRSISLPSRPHPLVPEFEEQLRRLRSSEATSTSSSSISHELNGLRDLYNYVEKLLQLHLHQQILSQDHGAKWVDDLLDGSLRLLDVCSTVRDVLSLTRESVRHIQSVLRRSCSRELRIPGEVVEYANTRKKVKHMIKKCLKDIKSMQSKNDGSIAIVGMLRDVEAVTVQIFESLLCYIAGPKTRTKKSSWLLVSKLMHHNTVCNKEEIAPSEFAEADAALDSLASQKKKTGINIVQADQTRSQMAPIEFAIEDLDEQVESLFRCMVKTRAAILNILKSPLLLEMLKYLDLGQERSGFLAIGSNQAFEHKIFSSSELHYFGDEDLVELVKAEEL